MKFPIISTVAVAMCALAASVQAELKVAAVNMQDLYKSYYKRFDAEKSLAAQKEAIEKDIAERSEKLKAMAEELNAIRAQADPTLSETARQRVQAEYAAKLNEVQAAEQEFNSFRQRKNVAFQEMQKRRIMTLLQDIQNVVAEKSQADDYDLVIDMGAVAPPLGIKVFPFVKNRFDITLEVTKVLNQDAPAGFDPNAELNGGAATTELPAN